MPRNVRNFWIEATIDGRSSKLEGGPQAKDGGFELTIRQRDKGAVTKVLTIRGTIIGDLAKLDRLRLSVHDVRDLGKGMIFHHDTKR